MLREQDLLRGGMVVETGIDGVVHRRTFLVGRVDMELVRRIVYDRSLDDLLVVYYTPFLDETRDGRGRGIEIEGVSPEGDIVLVVEGRDILLSGGYLVDS